MKHRARGGEEGNRQEQVVYSRGPWSQSWGTQPSMPHLYQAELLLLKALRMRKGCIC